MAFCVHSESRQLYVMTVVTIRLTAKLFVNFPLLSLFRNMNAKNKENVLYKIGEIKIMACKGDKHYENINVKQI
jgi:hypothetical protein